ncbi:MAG: alpha-L-rhamnosidase [Clostridia bacterium]|nr:alpha-L-rhamnosidase [Clostridia bacterium]
MLRIKEIAVNYQNNPVGIDKSPQFSWKALSDNTNVLQTAYHLQIGTNKNFSDIVFDSKKVFSEESAHILADGFDMKSVSKYFVRAKIWDNYGNESEWSDPAEFITAFLTTDEWKANFISGETPKDKDNSKGTYLRKTFYITKEVQEAYLLSTACGLYHPYINGHKAGHDELAPGWTAYQKRLLYQTYEVTDSICFGENTLAAHVGAGWYKGAMGFERTRNLYGEITEFSAMLVLRYSDGSEESIITDNSWHTSDSPVTFSEIYDGEIYDQRLEQAGWNSPGFDDTLWKNAYVCPSKKGILTAQDSCRVQELIPVSVKEIIHTPEGDTVLDFGQNLTGWVHAKINGSSGEKMVLNCFEVLDSNGNVYTENLRTAKETLTYICSGQGASIYRPNFTFQGFRYIKVAEYPGNIKKENFTAYAVHSRMDDTGQFSCSNPLLNQLQHNIEWGLKGNFVDIPTDCPQRDERLGWTGDAQIFCRTATFIKNTYPFFSKWLKDVAADQTQEGAVPHVVPDILSHRTDDDWLLKDGSVGATAWADVAVIAPWTLFLNYGDTRIIEEQYESMCGWVQFMTDHSEDHIWHYQRQFGDWVALDAEEGSYFGATPDEIICTAYYAYSTGLLAKMADAVGRTEDSLRYHLLYDDIVASYRRHFITDSGHMTARTQTAQIITLYFDLASKEQKEVIIKDLLELLAEHDGHLVTGFVGTPYFCHALSQNGCTKEAYELLLKEDFPSWLYQVKMGATTIWEHWDGLKPDGTMWSADMNSFNHYAYGAIGEWLYRVVVGIEADINSPGYKNIIFQPHIGGGLTYASGKYESIYGTIESSWKINNNIAELSITVPPNTTAKIILEPSAAICQDQKVDFHMENGHPTACIGSGKYQIDFKK